MKFLIDNYSSAYNTESLYINEVLNMLDGCSSSIRQSGQASVYDSFDLVNPDFYITHASKLSNDVITYLKENKNIYLLANISGLDQDNIKTLENVLSYHEISKAALFINYTNHGIVTKNLNLFVLPHGADIFLSDKNTVKYNIDLGIVVNNKSQITKREGTYHYLSNSQSMTKDADIVLPVMYMSNFYKNYNKIIFKSFGKIIPQSYFDAIFYSNNVEYEPDNDADPMKEVIGNLFSNCKTFDEIKMQVRNKHTCLHRTKSLLSQLPCNDLVTQLGKIIGETKWA